MAEFNIFARAQEFLKKIQEDDPPPVHLEVQGDGPCVQMELGLGVYDVADPTLLNCEGTPGTLPETQDSQSEDSAPRPLIEDITKPPA